MDSYVVLAGPTLDQALALVRLGLIQATPSDITRLERHACTGSAREFEEIRTRAPKELRSILTTTRDRPAHVMVAHKSDLHPCNLVQHVLGSQLPEGSFMWLCEGVLAPSWPLFFTLRCRDEPSLSGRLMLGMELCGSYSHLIVGDRSTNAYYRRPSRGADDELVVKWNSPKIAPVLTGDALSQYLDQAGGLKGVNRATEALRYLLDGSASPGESALALMATLPCRLGGYGFSGMKLNPTIKVEKERRHLTRFDTYRPDGYLEALETDLEYESDENHSGPKAVARDKARRNDIQALGIEVKDVTWEMLSHIDSLDLLFRQLLEKERTLGFDKRGRHRRQVAHPDSRAKRITRLHELLPPWPYEG